MKSAILNAILAIFWLLLSERPSLFQLLAGFFIGFWIIYLLRHLIGAEGYIRRVFAFHTFLAVFLKTFIRSNLNVAGIVLLKNPQLLKPGFIEYDIKGLNDFEIILLAQCISLTPGTTSTEINPEKTSLTLHVLEAENPEATRQEIDTHLKQRILAFSRS